MLAEAAKTADRVVIIEDSRELQCAAPNLVAMRTKDGVATLSDLVRSSLRLRPDRIPIGEVRGPEALDLLTAWGPDHPGGIGTIHAGSAIDCLPAIREAVGPDFPVMFDGGVRRGSDVFALLCCGVDYVFAGRPFLYGAAGFGRAGVHRTMEIFTEELSGLMRQLGCADLDTSPLAPFMIDRFQR